MQRGSTQPSRHHDTWMVTLLVLLVFAAGLAIRLFDLDDPPLDFHPARQIHSALISRGYFAKWGGTVPVEQQSQMIIMGVTEGLLEPPIMEFLTAYTYKAIDQANLVVPRLYAIFFWMLGGYFLWLLSSRLLSRLSGALAVGIYLLLPYSIHISRSFQPEPLFICLILAAVWAFIRWHEQPTWPHTILAGLLFGLAIYSKQIVLFYGFGLLFAHAIAELGLGKSFKNPKFIVIAVLALLPLSIYMLRGLADGSMTGNTALRFFPQLWFQPAFYVRWLRQIQGVIGLGTFVLALSGMVLSRQRLLRVLTIGLLGGYVLSGFGLSYHISTHDYYHVLMIPLAALGLAALFETIATSVEWPKRSLLAHSVLTGLALIWAGYQIYTVRSEMKTVDNRDKPQFWAGLTERMGGMNASVIGLLKDYGAGLNYYGLMYPQPWEKTGDVMIRSLGKEQYLQDFQQKTEGRHFFVITDFADLARQPELQEALFTHYPVFEQGSDYIVFDLRSPGPQPNPPRLVIP